MKKILLSTLLSTAVFFAFATKPHIETVKVDARASSVKWIGSKVASSHEGNVKIQSGALSHNHGTLVGGKITIDMNSITCSDIESQKKNQYLVEHLKDDDFFNTEDFPLATISLKEVVRVEGDLYKISADLTIKGITNLIIFNADVKIKGSNFLAKANIKIDRTKWDVRYGSGRFFEDLGDKMILDEIEFDIFLLSVKK